MPVCALLEKLCMDVSRMNILNLSVGLMKKRALQLNVSITHSVKETNTINTLLCIVIYEM